MIVEKHSKCLILFIYITYQKDYHNTLYIKTLANLIILSIKNKLEKSFPYIKKRRNIIIQDMKIKLIKY
jgi:hypothetical protein